MDKRTLLAIGLCLAIFLAWAWIQPKIWPPPPPPPPGAKAAEIAPAAPEPPKIAVPPQVPAASGEKRPDHPDHVPIVLESKHLKVTLTNRGAGIQEAIVTMPRDAVKLLDTPKDAWPNFALRHVGGPDAIETLNWEVKEATSSKVEFRYVLRSNVEIRKTFTLDPDRHILDLSVSIENKNAPPPGKAEKAEEVVPLEFLAFNALQHDSTYRYEQYLTGVTLKDESVMKVPLATVEKGEAELAIALKGGNPTAIAEAEKYLKIDGPRKTWFGLKSRFFTALALPDPDAERRLDSYWFRMETHGAGKDLPTLKNLSSTARLDVQRVGSQPVTFSISAFLGPVQEQALKEVSEAPKMLSWGANCASGCPLSGLFFPIIKVIDMVAPLILGVLLFFGNLFNNYGVGIIITTICIRLCLFPLSLKSQRSAMQMQALGPKIQALKERYKADQQKLGTEQMRLFRENGVNPMAGCFPVFLQMPIFMAMYGVFELSVELRKAPFVSWIQDLSQPDHLMGPWNPINLPLLPVIDAFNLLPILMTIVWFLQAYYAPRSPDPQMAAQQKIMMFMPIMFGVMCYGLASGLSLYFLVNSMLGMLEQKLIKKYFLKKPSTVVKPAV